VCGRFTITASAVALKETFPLFDLPDHVPRYNMAPTQMIPAIVQRGDGPKSAFLRWGLVPHWADDAKIGYRMINARAETVASKPAFRSPFRKRRCLVLADGYYEWQKREEGKQPYWICRCDRRPFAFAGLWDHWEKGDKPIDSCTLITTSANDFTAAIHDRMPVILDSEDHDLWLDTEAQEPERLQRLLVPCAIDLLTAFPVSTLVNNPRVDKPDCVRPLESPGTLGNG